MEKETQQLKDWYTEYKEKKLEQDIKRCNVFAIVTGSVATLSSLIVAGNIAIGNGLEALQVGGSTVAMVAYLMNYSKMKSSYKKEQKAFQERQTNSKGIIKDRLEVLKHELEINDAYLNMNYLVAGGFSLSALGHILELLSMPTLPNVVTSITGAALSALVAVLNLKLSKTYKSRIKNATTEIEGLEEIQELEEMSKQPIQELIQKQGTLELEAPQEEPEQPKLLQLEDIPKHTK